LEQSGGCFRRKWQHRLVPLAPAIIIMRRAQYEHGARGEPEGLATGGRNAR